MLIYADFDPAGSGVGAGLGWGIAAVACLWEGGDRDSRVAIFQSCPGRASGECLPLEARFVACYGSVHGGKVVGQLRFMYCSPDIDIDIEIERRSRILLFVELAGLPIRAFSGFLLGF